MAPVPTDPTIGPEFDPDNPEKPKHEKLDPALRDKPNHGGVNPTGVGEHRPVEESPVGPD